MDRKKQKHLMGMMALWDSSTKKESVLVDMANPTTISKSI